MEDVQPARQKAYHALLPLWPRAYLPQFCWSIGYGGMLPVLALAATRVGASTAVAAFIVAVYGFGTVLFDLPAGRIIARIGEYPASRISTVVIAIGLAGCFMSKTPIELAIAVIPVAFGWGIWNLKVLTHLSRVAPVEVRGRALGLIGGVSRAGTAVGPLLLVLVAHNEPRASFLVFFIGSIAGFILISATRDRADQAAQAGTFDRLGAWTIVKNNVREIFTAGTGTFGISMLRGSRQALLPLWGAHIGLSTSTIGVIYGVSSILDVAFFYPAGIVSDRFGRKAVAIPCLALLSLGHILLPFTHAASSLFLCALLLSFGNSLGSGIVMTLGADRAPDYGRASFLAVWRVIGDSGTATGPLLVGAIVAVASLAASGWIIGALGLVTVYVVLRYMDDPIRGGARGVRS